MGSEHAAEAPGAESARAINPAALVATGHAARKTTVPRVLPVYVPPHPIKQVMPRGLSRESVIDRPVQVDIQLRIDETGRVSEVHLAKVSGGNESLARSAMAAAKEWIFQPATMDGKNVPSDHMVEFRFTPEPR